MKNIYSKIVRDALVLLGSKAGTESGAARALKKHPAAIQQARECEEKKVKPCRRFALDSLQRGDAVMLDNGLRGWEGYYFIPLTDADCAARAQEAIGTCGQRTNYVRGDARIFGKAHQATWTTITYKGRYKGYTGKMLHWHYQSAVGHTRRGRSAIVIQECRVIRRIVTPKGMLFTHDNNGIMLRRETDGMDYHPTPEDWSARNFASRVRKNMAANFVKRLAAKKVERETIRLGKIYERQILSTRVTLEDSRRAGNCVEGSLAFCERRLRLSREDILAGSYLFSVPAKNLIDNANGNLPQVQNAVRVAWMRETTISI